MLLYELYTRSGIQSKNVLKLCLDKVHVDHKYLIEYPRRAHWWLTAALSCNYACSGRGSSNRPRRNAGTGAPPVSELCSDYRLKVCSCSWAICDFRTLQSCRVGDDVCHVPVGRRGDRVPFRVLQSGRLQPEPAERQKWVLAKARRHSTAPTISFVSFIDEVLTLMKLMQRWSAALRIDAYSTIFNSLFAWAMRDLGP